jgi:DNA-binding LacI/PurR family transcriptional regulator
MANVSTTPVLPDPSRRGRNRVTCIDVARIVGVAPSTVSRVINSSHRVSAVTRDRVMNVIKTTGYRPLQSASSLSRRTHSTIGLISEFEDSNSASYNTELIRGVSLTLTRFGLRLAMDMVRVRSEAHAIEALPLFQSVSIDGLILDVCQARGNISEVADDLRLPLVFVNAPEPRSYNTVMPDDVAVARSATDYLIQRGHRSIAYIPGAGVNVHSSQALRMNGYSQALLKSRLHPVPGWDVPTFGDGYQPADYVDRLREYQRQGCTGVVTYNAPAAACLLRACVQLGVSVPHDLSIISCDYDPMVHFAVVPITCYKLDREKMGTMGVEMLLQRIEHESHNVPSVFLTGELREAESVRTLSTGGNTQP